MPIDEKTENQYFENCFFTLHCLKLLFSQSNVRALYFHFVGKNINFNNIPFLKYSNNFQKKKKAFILGLVSSFLFSF